MNSLDQLSLADLSARFSGVLLRPGESGYDDVRRVHNGMIDRRPALIARCLGSADIRDAVNFARTRGLDLAVRGGGNNVAGRAVCDDGMMLDLSLMKGIHVDPARRTARRDEARPVVAPPLAPKPPTQMLGVTGLTPPPTNRPARYFV